MVYSLSPFSAFSFCMFATLTVLFLFLSASIVCFHNSQMRTAYLVLWFPDKTLVCTHPWQNDPIVLRVPLKLYLTKLNSFTLTMSINKSVKRIILQNVNIHFLKIMINYLFCVNSYVFGPHVSFWLRKYYYFFKLSKQ